MDAMKITGPRVVTEVSVIIIITIAAVYMDNHWIPPRPGIRCHDPAINHPKRDNTISPRTVTVVSVYLPFCIFFLYDMIIYKPRWSYIYQNLVSFMLGIVLVFVTNNFVKYNLGWPRPYYLHACDPDYSKMDCSSGYVLDPPCRGDAHEIKLASLTFPSLHSSSAAYGMTYLFMFLCQRNNDLSRHYVLNTCSVIVQCLAITWYVFVAVSRVNDFRHHVTDVIAGSIWGLVFALILVIRCSGLIKRNGTDMQEVSQTTATVTHSNHKTD